MIVHTLNEEIVMAINCREQNFSIFATVPSRVSLVFAHLRQFILLTFKFWKIKTNVKMRLCFFWRVCIFPFMCALYETYNVIA